MATSSGNPSNKSALTGKFADNGRDIALLQPENQVALIADAATLSGGESPTEAEHNALAAKVNSIIDALIEAGIMKSS